MNRNGSGIPSISTLLAFEATAQLGSMNRAAEELKTSTSAISRYISRMESELDARLFERKGRGLLLTESGTEYFAEVQSSLQSLRAAGHRLRSRESTLTVGCTQEISVMLLLPIYSRLKGCLDEGVHLRILNCDYDVLPLLLPSGVDLIFEYSTPRLDDTSARVLDEEIVPAASPAFIENFKAQLARHPGLWTDVPRLDVASHDVNWATWTTWFGSYGCDLPEAPVETFENYLFLMEAAANGDGIALAWNGFANGYFETGRLVPLTNEWFRTEIGLYAILTPSGRNDRNARHLLKALATLTRELAGDHAFLQSAMDRRPAEGRAG